MENDLYGVLGVAKSAAGDDIRKSYRALAKKYHPDLNPGDAEAEETFKKVQTAYDILSDEDKRRQYDSGEIDADGNEVQRGYYRDHASADGESPYHSSAGFDDFSDMFSDLFRARGSGGPSGARGPGGPGANIRMRGGDVRYTMEISLTEAVNGAKKRVTMADGKSLDITIPPGLRDGQMLRLRGKGMAGFGGGDPGDAYVKVDVAPHKMFHRRGNDIHLDLPIAVNEAVLGAKIRVPTVDGAVTMTVPAGSNTGDTLRLKGKGAPSGEGRPEGAQIVTLRVVLPESPDEELTAFMESWAEGHAYDPRAAMEGHEDAR